MTSRRRTAKAGTKWTHRIDPHVDREREWVQTDLLFVGTGVAYVNVDRPTAPKKLGNATGRHDRDGREDCGGADGEGEGGCGGGEW